MKILINTGDLLMVRDASIMDGYNWEQGCTAILGVHERGSELAIAIAKGIISASSQNKFSIHTFDYYIKRVLELLLSDYVNQIWPLLGDALLSDDPLLEFNLKYLLGSKFEHEGDKKGPLFSISDEVILKWCEDKSPRAPRIIAEIMPFYIKEGDTIAWYPIAKKIIDKFGNDEDVLRALSVNMGTFSWSGSLVPFYQQTVALMNSLIDHPIEEVAEWAKKYSGWCKEQISRETMRDDESTWGIL